MNKTLTEVRAEVKKLSPVEAEVWVIAEATTRTPTTELRGRIVGPRCPGTATVEVSYPLRPLNGAALAARVVVPDPTLWEEGRPFVYRVFVELWEGETHVDGRTFEMGLRLPAPTKRV